MAKNKSKKSQEVQSYRKVVIGYVIQEYILNKHGKYVCTEQYFEFGEDVAREDDDGPVKIDASKEVFQHFDMVQPISYEDFEEWFDENKHSGLLLKQYMSCLNDNPDMTDSFRQWAKTYYDKNIAQEG
jgi:hypothetical protein